MRRCRHVWKITQRDDQPSGFEQLAVAHLTQVENLSNHMFERPVIVQSRCETCGTEKVERI